MTAPGTFSNRATTAGNRLVLQGANGEDVVISEHHPTERGSKESLEVIVRTVLVATNGVLHGLQELNQSTLEVPDLTERVTEYLWNQL